MGASDVYVCKCACMSECGGGSLEDNIECCSSANIHLFFLFETGSPWPGAHGSGLSAWPVRSRDPPVSTSLFWDVRCALRPGLFYMGSEELLTTSGLQDEIFLILPPALL